MEKIQVKTIGDFETFVNNIQINTYYELPPNCRYKWIKIEKDKEYFSKDTYYCWAMEYNYNVAGCVGYIYPMRNANYVSHFKTEKGAKRNLIKSYKDYFNTFSKANKQIN